ncbi:MAG: polysaccharide biosynthesis tyrosine autokinase, partial [Polyangiaceae bacterium]
DAATWLNGQVDHYKDELEANEDALQAFKQRNQLPATSVNQASDMMRLEMQEYDSALTRTRTRKEELLARHAELSAVADGDPARLPASELLSDMFLQTLRAQYLEAMKERSALVAMGKGDSHPFVRQADEKIAYAKSALLAEVQNVKGAVERDLAVVQREEAGESGLLDASRHLAIDLNMKEIEYRRLDRSREETEKLYSMLLERMKEADLARMLNVNEMRLVDGAVEPRAPIRPNVPLNLAIGGLLGLMLGVGLVFAVEQLDNTLKTPLDLEQKLGITFLGLLPEIDDNADPDGRPKRKRHRKKTAAKGGFAELIVHNKPRSGIAEAARSIRTNLLFMNPDKPYSKLLVSSAAPSEGKTTIACSIAIAMAQGGQQVCIVDCDLRRPRLHRIFDCVGASGVTNYLVGDAPFEDIVSPTAIDNLSCIPSGPIPPNPADLFHSERFKRFIGELGKRFDRIIIDSPPLAAVTDSAIISTLVDGTVFVTRAFKTTRSVCSQGLRALADVDAHVVGGVLNAVDFGRLEYQYHYYYYKREGYSTSPGPNEGEASEQNTSPPN